ncbi:MAG: hypothetical protein H6R01_214 [Burkholderiaceae bacterium]|nr:hypothetical protein [Burkholderiaceae bacterium]
MKKKIITVLISGALFAVSSPALAVCDGCVVGAVNKMHEGVKSAIETSTASLTALLQMINNNLANVGSKVSESIAQASNSQREMAIEVQRKTEKERIERTTELPVDPCASSSSNFVATALTNSASRSSSYRRGGGGSAPSSATLARKMADPIPTVEGTRKQTYAIHSEKYCSVVENKIGYAGCNATNMPDGDANIESLLTGAGKPGKEPDMTFSKEQEEAGRAYASLSVDPHGPEHLTKAEANTEQGRLYIAMQKAYQANMSAAEKPAFDAIAARVPFSGSQALINELKKAEGAAKYYDATASKVAKSTGTMSLAELQDFEAGRRFRNPYWIIAMGAEADPTKLQREGIYMQAFANEMLYQMFRRMEQQDIRLGLILASLTRNEMMPKIETQRQRVAAAR